MDIGDFTEKAAMQDGLVYLNGKFVSQADAVLPIHDAGIVSGVTVTDFCRTFRHRLYRWREHLERFRRDCAACSVPLAVAEDELTRAAHHLVEHNARLLSAEEELALITFATPGPLGGYVGQPGADGPPTCVMHTFPLAFIRYRRFFSEGVALAVAGHHGAHPADLAPPDVKHRSRLHWWRADHLLRQRQDVPPRAVALLLDAPAGRITETAIGHVLVVREGVVYVPPRGSVLSGISVGVVVELCDRMGVRVTERALTVPEAQEGSEAMLTGTAFCLAGVRWLEGRELPWPGPITTRLQRAWSEEVGLDVAGQVLGVGGERSAAVASGLGKSGNVG